MNDNYEADLRTTWRPRSTSWTAWLHRPPALGVGGHSYGPSARSTRWCTPFFRRHRGHGIQPHAHAQRFRASGATVAARETYIACRPSSRPTPDGALLSTTPEDQKWARPRELPRLFHALQGLGKTTSLYMYPYEDHGPASRETLLDLWSRGWRGWTSTQEREDGDVGERCDARGARARGREGCALPPRAFAPSRLAPSLFTPRTPLSNENVARTPRAKVHAAAGERGGGCRPPSRRRSPCAARHGLGAVQVLQLQARDQVRAGSTRGCRAGVAGAARRHRAEAQASAPSSHRHRRLQAVVAQEASSSSSRSSGRRTERSCRTLGLCPRATLRLARQHRVWLQRIVST